MGFFDGRRERKAVEAEAARIAAEQKAARDAILKEARARAEEAAAKTLAEGGKDAATDAMKGAADRIVAKERAQAAKLLEKQVAREAKALEQAASKTGFLTRLGRDGFRKTIGKPALIGTGVVAGIAALGVLANRIRSNRKEASKFEAMPDPVNDIPPVMPSMDAMGQNTMMGMQPVEGARAQAVKASREAGMGSPQQGL